MTRHDGAARTCSGAADLSAPRSPPTLLASEEVKRLLGSEGQTDRKREREREREKERKRERERERERERKIER